MLFGFVKDEMGQLALMYFLEINTMMPM